MTQLDFIKISNDSMISRKQLVLDKMLMVQLDTVSIWI